MSNLSHAQGNGGDDDGEVINIEAVKQLLRTPYDDVFELSPEGLTYKKPASLFGTPVQKIVEENSTYWNPA